MPYSVNLGSLGCGHNIISLARQILCLHTRKDSAVSLKKSMQFQKTGMMRIHLLGLDEGFSERVLALRLGSSRLESQRTRMQDVCVCVRACACVRVCVCMCVTCVNLVYDVVMCSALECFL
jgi:hypothetical protein